MIHNNNIMDIEIDTLRSAKPSANISREISAHLSIFSILYIERMGAQNKNSSWAD